MLEPITNALMFIMQPCYDICGNWWVAIALFTLVVKVILMPMALWCQYNSIVMVRLMPDLNRIKVRYFGDAEAIGEKQNALYKEKKYHPLLSLVPLAVQLLILFGLVDVVHYITDNGAAGTELLGLIPIEDGGISWFMPLFAGLSAVVMGFAQNRINPLQREQSRAEKNTTNGLSIALSFFLGVFVASGMAFYWVCSNLLSIAVQALCNICIRPAKYIDYEELEASRKELKGLTSLNASKPKWYQRDPNRKREKTDYKRFMNIVDKHLVFYSESSGFYRYFQGAIEWLLANSQGNIHYITNDPNDKIFELACQEPRIKPYYISETKLITLMMKMDADVVAMTLEDLENYYIKRSYVRKDTQYVFFFHHMTSTHLGAKEQAYDHYDHLLCAGPHQVKEIRRAEELRNLPAKDLVECGYDLLDRGIAAHEARMAAGAQDLRASTGTNASSPPQVLIAPSWQPDNILDLCAEELIGALLGNGWRIVVRPHPEYTKRFKPRWEALQARFENISEDELYFERDFSSNESVYSSDVLITDWSSVACDFSFSTLKPCVFIDTPMKVGNPNWEALGIEPTDISLRNEIGVSLAPNALGAQESGAFAVVKDMIENPDAWKARIEDVRAKTIFNLGHAGDIAGKFLLDLVLEKQREKFTGQDETGQVEAKQNAASQNEAGHDKASQDDTSHNEAGQIDGE